MDESRSVCGTPESIDTTPYGAELAGRIADYLVDRKEIVHSHPYYCGMGLFFRDHEFVYADVWDAGLGFEGTHAVFPTRDAFVGWLSRQSDDSLHGHDAKEAWLRGNQRITRARLEFVLASAARADAPGPPSSVG